jgi:hypothetical protein
MPQFDIFSFFSQLFWVFLAFGYLYLILSFYLLPAFAIVLKVRAKKLAQLNVETDANSIAKTSTTNTVFFEHFSTQLNNISFFRKNLTNDINIAVGQLLFKNESFYNFNFLMLNRFKIVTFFL